MTKFETVETKITVEGNLFTTFGIKMNKDGHTVATVADVCPDREFTEKLAKTLERLGVEEDCLLETVAEAVNERYSI